MDLAHVCTHAMDDRVRKPPMKRYKSGIVTSSTVHLHLLLRVFTTQRHYFAYDSVAYDPVKTRLSDGMNQPITKPEIEHCDWFILSLLLPTSTL